MAKSANLYARIEPEVKEQAEAILSALGIPASNAITMFYKQVILQRGLPFEVKLPEHPLDVSRMTAEQMDTELEKGYAQMKAGQVIPDEYKRQFLKISDLRTPVALLAKASISSSLSLRRTRYCFSRLSSFLGLPSILSSPLI